MSQHHKSENDPGPLIDDEVKDRRVRRRVKAKADATYEAFSRHAKVHCDACGAVSEHPEIVDERRAKERRGHPNEYTPWRYGPWWNKWRWRAPGFCCGKCYSKKVTVVEDPQHIVEDPGVYWK